MAWSSTGPQYCHYDDLRSWIDDADANPVELIFCIDAASRAIEKACNRQFGQVASPEPRYYTGEYHRDLCRWIVDIDDVMTTAGLVVEVDNDGDGTYDQTIASADYQLTPINSAANGRPWTRIEVLPKSLVKPNGRHNGVKVTARWGWSTIPYPILLATMLQASRLFARRDEGAGPLVSKRVDDVQLDWSGPPSGELDPDLLTSVVPFRRVWGAV